MPAGWSGSRVDLLWDSASEATLWLDGLPAQGLNRHHRDAVLVERGRSAGERIVFEVELACNDLFGEQHAPYELHLCELGRFDADAWRLSLDFEILRALSDEPGLDEAWAGELLAELNRFCNVWPEPGSDGAVSAILAGALRAPQRDDGPRARRRRPRPPRHRVALAARGDLPEGDPDVHHTGALPPRVPRLPLRVLAGTAVRLDRGDAP